MSPFPIGPKPSPVSPLPTPAKPAGAKPAEAPQPVAPASEAPQAEAPEKSEGPEAARTEPLTRLRLSNHTDLPKDLEPAFSQFNLGVDLGFEHHFGNLIGEERQGKFELFATPSIGLNTHGETEFGLSLNAGSEYLFRNNLLIGGETSVGVRFPQGADTEFFSESRGTVGYQFDLGHDYKLTPQIGGGFETDFHEVNPFATAGAKLEKGRHQFGVNLQYGGSELPVMTNFTYALRFGK